MATEEVYAARLGAWIARALAASVSFAVDVDTDGLGFQLPASVANDPAVKAAAKALAEAGNALRGGADTLDAAVLSGDTGGLTRAFLQLFDGLYRYVDSAEAIVARINARAASLPPAQANATIAFASTLTAQADRPLPRPAARTAAAEVELLAHAPGHRRAAGHRTVRRLR